MFTQITPAEVFSINAPTVPIIQPEEMREHPARVGNTKPSIGVDPQVHKIRTLEARRRRATRRANRH